MLSDRAARTRPRWGWGCGGTSVPGEKPRSPRSDAIDTTAFLGTELFQLRGPIGHCERRCRPSGPRQCLRNGSSPSHSTSTHADRCWQITHREHLVLSRTANLIYGVRFCSKAGSMPNVEPELTTLDQELHALPTEPARRPSSRICDAA